MRKELFNCLLSATATVFVVSFVLSFWICAIVGAIRILHSIKG